MRLCDQNGTKNIKTYCIPTCGQCLFSLHVIHLHFTTPRNMFCRPSSSPSAASLDRACGGTEGWRIFIYTCDFLCEFGICIFLHTMCIIVNLHRHNDIIHVLWHYVYVMYKFFTCSSYTVYAQKDSRTLNKPEVLRSSWFHFTYLQIPPGLYKFPCKVGFFIRAIFPLNL